MSGITRQEGSWNVRQYKTGLPGIVRQYKKGDPGM
jgi:hypothetical protein